MKRGRGRPKGAKHDPAALYYALVGAYKAEVLRRALGENGGNRTRAAAHLGLPRTYFQRLIKERGIA